MINIQIVKGNILYEPLIVKPICSLVYANNLVIVNNDGIESLDYNSDFFRLKKLSFFHGIFHAVGNVLNYSVDCKLQETKESNPDAIRDVLSDLLSDSTQKTTSSILKCYRSGHPKSMKPFGELWIDNYPEQKPNELIIGVYNSNDSKKANDLATKINSVYAPICSDLSTRVCVIKPSIV